MKLIRFGDPGRERPGLLAADGSLRDLSGVIADVGGVVLSPAGLARLREIDPARLPPVPAGSRLGPPVAGVGKIVCIGLNYADHAQEAALPLPPEPVVFLKATSALSGPDDPVVLPPGSDRTDWELELAVVIGTEARRVGVDAALAHVAGYCTGLDLSERHWQLERGGQWSKGKSFDSFAPIGPWLVTADEIASVRELAMELSVNGQRFQNSNTGNMIFGVAQLVSYVSGLMSLQPGDLIFTGTPAGVGMGCKPPRYLRDGDRLDAEIAGLGRQRHAAVAR